MAEDDQAEPRRHGRFWRRVIAGLVVCVALLVLVHRPILLAIGRRIVLNYAAEHNLKADFRVEGNPFGSVTIRNLHAFAVGPSEYESIDADYVYLDYSLFGFARHGLPRLFNDVEARSASHCFKSFQGAVEAAAAASAIEVAKVLPGTAACYGPHSDR